MGGGDGYKWCEMAMGDIQREVLIVEDRRGCETYQYCRSGMRREKGYALPDRVVQELVAPQVALEPADVERVCPV